MAETMKADLKKMIGIAKSYNATEIWAEVNPAINDVDVLILVKGTKDEDIVDAQSELILEMNNRPLLKYLKKR